MICWKKEGQGPEDILLKIVPLVCMLPYLLKTILTARFLYRIFWLLCRAAWDSGLLLAIVNLVLAASTMLSCGLCTVMLLRFSVRRTKEDVGSLYLGVICAEALRLIVATIQLLWNGIRMVTVPFYLPVRLLLWPWLLALFLAAAVICGLSVSLSMFDKKPFIGKDRDEIRQMLRSAPGQLHKGLPSTGRHHKNVDKCKNEKE